MTLAMAEALAPHADFIAADSAVWDHPKGPAAGAAAFADILGSVADTDEILR